MGMFSSGARGVVALLVMGMASTCLAAVQAGPFVNPANGHSYYLLQPGTWTAAEGEAVSLGGHLAAIADVAENDYVFNTFAPFVPTTTHDLWIGLTDSGVEGTFTWTNGEPLGYTNWATGEPNNDPGFSDPAGEDYVAMVLHAYNFAAPKKWNDATVFGSDRTMHGVVEVVPEPGVASLVVIATTAGLFRRRRAVRI